MKVLIVTSPNSLRSEQSRTREACVDLYLDTGGLEGGVFEDLNGDGAFRMMKTSRTQFDGQVFRLDSGLDTPDAIQETGDDGRYSFTQLTVGTYRLEVVSPEGTVLNAPTEVTVDGQNSSVADLVREPTGRIYDSVTGALVDGARVWLYEDLDADDDPLDEDSAEKLVLVPETDFEHPSHQGQRTHWGRVSL